MQHQQHRPYSQLVLAGFAGLLATVAVGTAYAQEMTPAEEVGLTGELAEQYNRAVESLNAGEFPEMSPEVQAEYDRTLEAQEPVSAADYDPDAPIPGMSPEARRQYDDLLASMPTPEESGIEYEGADVDKKACAIYLCLPVGFAVPGCGGALNEMRSRLFKGKSPAPSFSSCSYDGQDHGLEVHYNKVKKLKRRSGDGPDAPDRYAAGMCVEPDHNDREKDCTGSYRRLAATQNGVLIGDILYDRIVPRPRRDRPDNFNDND